MSVTWGDLTNDAQLLTRCEPHEWDNMSDEQQIHCLLRRLQDEREACVQAVLDCPGPFNVNPHEQADEAKAAAMRAYLNQTVKVTFVAAIRDSSKAK